MVPQRGLAFELISTYVGYPGVATHVTHLTLGLGRGPVIEHHEDQDGDLDPALRPRACVYEHAEQLLERLSALGHHAGLRVQEGTFLALEAVE